jgi:hypothetical protein
MEKRYKNLFKMIWMSLFVFIFLCLCGELALRARQFIVYGSLDVPSWLLPFPSGSTNIYHPFLRSLAKPGFTKIMHGSYSVLLWHNSQSFRSDEITIKKPAGTFRICCVGGSAVYDTRVDIKDAWPTQLQAMLRKKFPSKKIEVVNAGLPGRTSADSLVNVGLRILPLKPDVIIIYHGINDPKPNAIPGFSPDYSNWYEKQWSLSFRMINSIIDHSMLLAYIRIHLMPLINRGLRDNEAGLILERTDVVSENLQSIIAMAHRQGCKVVMSVFGYSLKSNCDLNGPGGKPDHLLYFYPGFTMKGIKTAFTLYNKVNEEVGRSDADILVNIEKNVPSTSEYYQDEVHFTPKGSRYAARTFLDDVPWEKWID